METRILLSKSWIVFVLFDGFSARVFLFSEVDVWGFFFMGGCFLVQSLSFTVYYCFFCELLKICVSTLPILLGSECSASS